MQNIFFNPQSGEKNIITGYIGAIVVLSFSLAIIFFNLENTHFFNVYFQRDDLLISMIFSTFISMLLADFLSKRSYVLNRQSIFEKTKIKKTSFHLIISTLYRYVTLLVIFYLIFIVVNKHYYFADDSFQITKKFLNIFFTIYLILGIPYIFLTLKYKWSIKYEFNDYSIHLMLFFRGLIYGIYGTIFNKKKYRKKGRISLTSRRVKKILLTYLVIFFFLTLMTNFLGNEFNEFSKALKAVLFLNSNYNFIDKYHAVYLTLYHLIFLVDVSLAIIGYTVASRWLDNRTKSVDMTVGGWIVALICYPPMNSGFTSKFIDYGMAKTQPIITSDIGREIIMALILLLISIYLWATISLGFKFSNLTNRGIVTTGPYAIVRHPAYIAKNLSWWLDNTFVLSNFWAVLALAAWNIIYILRALTEERHLQKDPQYRAYCQKVRYRFIPGLI